MFDGITVFVWLFLLATLHMLVLVGIATLGVFLAKEFVRQEREYKKFMREERERRRQDS